MMLTVAGLGNRHCGDDAVGLYLLESIENQLADNIQLLFWEDMDALSLAAELITINNPIVIVDCADMGLDAGEFRWIDASKCRLTKHFDSVSTHGFGFSEALVLVQQLGFNQPLSFFVVQPDQLQQQTALSPLLIARMERMNKALITRLNSLADNLPSL